MKAAVRLIFAVALVFSLAEAAFAQLGMFSKDQLIALTREWKGDRFPDGRPKVPDSVLAGLSDVNAEQAWNVLIPHGYKYQFEGGWREINPGVIVLAGFVGAFAYLNKLSYAYVPLIDFLNFGTMTLYSSGYMFPRSSPTITLTS